MVTAEKTARTMLKQANELGNTLREIVLRDLADETRRFNDTLTQRIQLASEAIVQAVKAKEAIAAGASSINSKLEKAHRRYSKNNNLEEFRGVLQSTLVEVQQLREQHETVAESLREAQTPSRSAVEIVERFAIELQKAASVRRASTWTDGYLSMGADALSASAASRKQACSSGITLDSFRAAMRSAHLSVVFWSWPLHPTIVLHLLRVAVCQVGFGRRE